MLKLYKRAKTVHNLTNVGYYTRDLKKVYTFNQLKFNFSTTVNSVDEGQKFEKEVVTQNSRQNQSTPEKSYKN